MRVDCRRAAAPDSGNGPDTGRAGVRALGAYWGASGENIDTTSGNLNFSTPLIKPISRGSWSLPFVLSYNSQMWRQAQATANGAGRLPARSAVLSASARYSAP